MNEEQKRREMQIERMQEDLLNCLVFSRNGGVKCGDTAEALYNAGYRKADEVRKETAEKILEKIRNSFWMNRNNRYALKLWLKEQFGVEIKE